MGHMLNNTIQDVLIRKARMEGKKPAGAGHRMHAAPYFLFAKKGLK